MEIEAKFRVPDEATFSLLEDTVELGHFSISPGRLIELHDRYLDTPDHSVLAAGYFCRRRESSDGIVMTFKGTSGDEGGGVHRREEVSVELGADAPPSLWPEGPARELALRLTGDRPLETLFELRQERLERAVATTGRTVAELALDRVTIETGRGSDSFMECEIELRADGTEDDLQQLVAVVGARWRLDPVSDSKFVRGLALASGVPVERVREWQRELRRLRVQRWVERTRGRGQTGPMRVPALDAAEVARVTGLGVQEGATEEASAGLEARTAPVAAAEVERGAEPEASAGAPVEPPVRAAEIRAEEVGGDLPEGEGHGAEVAEVETAVEAVEIETAVEAAGVEVAAGEVETADVEPPLAAAEARGSEEPPAEQPAAEEPLVEEPGPAEPVEKKGRARPGIVADDTMDEAARKTLLSHFERMLKHEAGTRKGEDPEDLHDMRVATRRMRAALRVFDGYVDRAVMKPYLKALRRTGRTLGTVRDLDVFFEKTQRYLHGLPEDAQGGLDPLLAAWKARRGEAREVMIDYLDSDDFERFTRRFGEFLHSPGAAATEPFDAEGEPVPRVVRDALPVVLFERLAHVRAFADWVEGPDVPLTRYHRLRIASKGLRYTLEFFEEVLGEGARPLIEDVKNLQDHLGDLQDAVVGCGVAGTFLTWGTWEVPPGRAALVPHPVYNAPGVATYLAHRQEEIAELIGTFPPVWARVGGEEFLHGVAELIAGL